MGYSVNTLTLLQTMHSKGLLSDVRRVIDLGSQEMHFAARDAASHPYREMIRQTIELLGGQKIRDDELDAISNRAPTSDFYKLIGWEHKALDADGWYGDPFDLNLDTAQDDDRGAYCLCMNFGTTEHLIDQNNAFRVVHDIVRPGGMMLHSAPFLGMVDHGFFSYHPNFFSALAHFNSYELLGLWISVTGSSVLLPWNDEIAKCLKMPADIHDGATIICLLKKQGDLPFCSPFQAGYEQAQAKENLARYNYAIDGRLMSGVDAFRHSDRQIALETYPGVAILGELIRRIKRRLGL